MNDYQLKETESFDEYCHRITSYKSDDNLTWDAIASIINSQTGMSYSEGYYRKKEKTYSENSYYNDIENLLFTVAKERVKMSDERVQINALVRNASREETFREIAQAVAKEMNSKFMLPEPMINVNHCQDKIATLVISDWHYGIDIENSFNSYNPEIAVERVAQLRNITVSKCRAEGIKKLNVVNLGDMISGNIHLPLRLNSRIDVITQVIEVSELIAELLSSLSQEFDVDYYSTSDNHSRLEANKSNSIQLESLYRITDWYLKDRVPEVNFHTNAFGDDIVSFNIHEFDIGAVHGNKDKQNSVINKLTTFTKKHYDLILTAHLHHFSADESCSTITLANGSLMGTDDHAFDLRLHSEPSQNLIISSKYNVMETLYRIVLV